MILVQRYTLSTFSGSGEKRLTKNVSGLRHAVAKRIGLTKIGIDLFAVSALLVLGILAGLSALPASASPSAAQATPAGVTATLVPPNSADFAHSLSYVYLLNRNPIPYMPNPNDRILSVQAPAGSHPSSVQAFRTNPNGSVTQGNLFTWNVTSTSYNYIMSNPNLLPLGNYSVYAIVTFADGTQSRSNSVNFIITMSLPPLVTTHATTAGRPPYDP
jgi:hypothetical protein